MQRTRIAVLLLSSLVPVSTVLSVARNGPPERQAKIERGRRVFDSQCKQCHTLNASSKAAAGPNLYGIVGKKVGQAGQKAEFAYSQVLLDTKAIWTEQELDRFIKAPAEFAPGTTMAFSGLRNEEDRKALIEYLKAVPKLKPAVVAR